MRETDAELLARWRRVKDLAKDAQKRARRLQRGTGRRDRASRWAGCLLFTLSGIESEMEERGIKHGDSSAV